MPNFPRASLMLASVLFLVHSVLPGKGPFPLGVHFGARKITAAYIAADGQEVPVAAIGGGDQYEALVLDSVDNHDRKVWRSGKLYLRDTDELVEVPKDPESNPAIEAIFEDGLKRLKDRIQQTPEAAGLSITSLNFPRHFNDSMFGYARQAIFRSEPHLAVPWQVKRSHHVTRMAYRLNNCAAYGLDPAVCHDEDEDHHLLIIDLNDEYLDLCLADVGEHVFDSWGRQMSRTLGGKLMDSQDNDRTWEERMHEALQTFFDEHIGGEENSYVLDSLHAIVISGDARPGAFASVKASIASILPGILIKDSIDPLYVGAVGAAEMARWQVEDPWMVEDRIVGVEPVDFPSHDEL